MKKKKKRKHDPRKHDKRAPRVGMIINYARWDAATQTHDFFKGLLRTIRGGNGDNAYHRRCNITYSDGTASRNVANVQNLEELGSMSNTPGNDYWTTAEPFLLNDSIDIKTNTRPTKGTFVWVFKWLPATQNWETDIAFVRSVEGNNANNNSPQLNVRVLDEQTGEISDLNNVKAFAGLTDPVGSNYWIDAK